MAQVVWSSGKKAQVVELSGERITLRSEASFAPGTPAAGALADQPDAPLTVKVHGCRRVDDGFVITGRVVNLTRAVRALLEASLTGGAPTG